MRVYSLFDRKAREYGPLLLGASNEAMERALLEAVRQNRQTTLGLYPEDFDLMEVGEFDMDSGMLVPVSAPTFVFNARSVLLAQEARTVPPIDGLKVEARDAHS